MSKKEKEEPVDIVWWKLITVLVTFAIAIAIVVLCYSIYMKAFVAT